MKSTRIAALSVVTACAVFAACGDDTDNEGGGADAGTLFDAASSGDATTSADAAKSDAATGTDATVPDATVPDAASEGGGDAAFGDAANDAATPDATPDAATPITYASCKAALLAVPQATSGSYLIDPDGVGPLEPLNLYCDMAYSGGGWTLIFSNIADHFILDPGDAGSDAAADAAFYLREPAPGRLGALKGPHAQALALGATLAHIRTPFAAGAEIDGGADAGFITSIAPGDGGPSRAIGNLRTLALMNANGDGGFASDWTGPFANAAHLSFLIGGVCPNVNTTTYPQIYWACNNFTGLHVGIGGAKWEFISIPAPSVDMQVYVR